MAVPLSLGPVHHLRLTVTDVERSRAFYTELLGFQIAMDAPPPADDPHHDLATDLLQDGIVMVNGDLLLGLRPVDAERASDRFDPFRCGLDHLSFAVAGRAELEAALQAFEERGVEHSDITDLPPFGIAVLPFKDPDGVALEAHRPAVAGRARIAATSELHRGSHRSSLPMMRPFSAAKQSGNWSDLPLTRRMLGFDLDARSSLLTLMPRRSRRIQTDRLDDQTDDQLQPDKESQGTPPPAFPPA